MKLIIKIITSLVVLAVLIFGALVGYLSITEYKPDAREIISEQHSAFITPLDPNRVFEATIWNIGYAGLDASQDFFYDGGKKVRPSTEQAVKNIENIAQTLTHIAAKSDFILLQEVDSHAKRSSNINQVERLGKYAPYYDFAFNYRVKYVPVPVFDPMGYVNSGLMSISKHLPRIAIRHAFPSSYAFPKNLVFLKRAFLEQRFPLTNGKELIIINTHNSAYDDGSLKKVEMDLLQDFLTHEYQKGNYVVVGGDWNQLPPHFSPRFTHEAQALDPLRISKDFLPEWKFVYDDTTPTNRSLLTEYRKGETKTTVIDFFLISPNVQALSIKTHDLSFASSDHNPSTLTFTLL